MGATVENNIITNVSDAAKLKNPKADRLVGLEKPLQFECGGEGRVHRGRLEGRANEEVAGNSHRDELGGS